MLGLGCHFTVFGPAVREQERGTGRTFLAVVCFAVPGFTAHVLLSLVLVASHETCHPFLGHMANSAAEAEVGNIISYS